MFIVNDGSRVFGDCGRLVMSGDSGVGKSFLMIVVIFERSFVKRDFRDFFGESGGGEAKEILSIVWERLGSEVRRRMSWGARSSSLDIFLFFLRRAMWKVE